MSAGPAVADFKPPHGYEEIVATYGDPKPFIRPDGSFDRLWWERHLQLVRLPFPAPLPLAWAPEHVATHYRCHPKAAPAFRAVFKELDWNGHWPLLRNYGGLFEVRRQRGGRRLSVHAFAAAIDLNTDTNELGTPGDMPPVIVETFERHGFTWGGRWTRPDPQHFQLASGY